MLRCFGSLLVLSALASTTISQTAERPAAKVDQPAKDFRLRDVARDQEAFVTLSEFKNKKHVVLIFYSYGCGTCGHYDKRISKLMQDQAGKEVAFVVLRSSGWDTAKGMRDYFREHKIQVPVLDDEKNVVADYFNVQKTPTFFLIDNKGILRYRGSFDDNKDENIAKKPYLRDALAAVLESGAVKVKETEAFG